MVHVASVAAHFPQAHSGAYSAAKAGVCLLSRQIATEWGTDAVRSNVISPGMIRTTLTAQIYAHPGVEQARAQMTASGRVGEPEDIAQVSLCQRGGVARGRRYVGQVNGHGAKAWV